MFILCMLKLISWYVYNIIIVDLLSIFIYAYLFSIGFLYWFRTCEATFCDFDIVRCELKTGCCFIFTPAVFTDSPWCSLTKIITLSYFINLYIFHIDRSTWTYFSNFGIPVLLELLICFQ